MKLSCGILVALVAATVPAQGYVPDTRHGADVAGLVEPEGSGDFEVDPLTELEGSLARPVMPAFKYKLDEECSTWTWTTSTETTVTWTTTTTTTVFTRW